VLARSAALAHMPCAILDSTQSGRLPVAVPSGTAAVLPPKLAGLAGRGKLGAGVDVPDAWTPEA